MTAFECVLFCFGCVPYVVNRRLVHVIGIVGKSVKAVTLTGIGSAIHFSQPNWRLVNRDQSRFIYQWNRTNQI